MVIEEIQQEQLAAPGEKRANFLRQKKAFARDLTVQSPSTFRARAKRTLG